MYKRFLQLSLIAALIAAPIALRADSIMTGQFAINGTVQNSGNTLTFANGTLRIGTGTQTGSFTTLLTDGEFVTGGSPSISYNPYTANSGFLTVGTLVVTLQSLNEMTVGSVLNFSGVANLSATGFADTLANYSFSTSATGSSPFTATFIAQAAPSSVPEPSSLALFGSGALGLAGFAARKFRSARL
jgi:hypothetical protein